MGIENHVSGNQSLKQHVQGDAHTNSVESFWALLKRGYYGVHHCMSHKHLWRYANEFSGWYNILGAMLIDQMGMVVLDMIGKNLAWEELIT